MDGVLCSTDEYHYRAWKELADSISVPFDRTVNERLRGISRMDSLEIILEKSAKTYTPEEKRALADRKNARYRELLQNLSPKDADPDVVSTLMALRKRDLHLCVASSSKNARFILDRLALTSYFDGVCDGTQITRAKRSGGQPSSRRASSRMARVPEPGSRRITLCRASSSQRTVRPAKGWLRWHMPTNGARAKRRNP